LFRKVCEAVQYAHQNLVVHRDLKPSNILVDESGSPKLLDFGIAKVLVDEEAASASGTQTSRMLTPQYASPEQVKGEPITTASDIYSLGAVFYEALTWGPAHRVTTNSPAAWVRAVCEQEPLPPSAAAAECGSPLRFSPDLDKILLRAMQKDPRLRYESAGELSEDLRRYLEHLPVRAQSPTFRYRAGKFLRRNRVSAAAVALVALSLLGGLSLALYQARRAERRFQEVRRLARTFLFDIHEQLQPLPGSTVVQESVVRTSLQYLDSLARESTGDTSLLFELASAYQKIGDVQGYAALPNLGHAEAALQSHRKALELARQLVERDPSPPARRLLVRAHQRVAYLLTGEGELAAAMEHDREASRLGEELYAAAPGNPEDSRLLMNVYHLAGTQQLRQGDAAAARRSWQRQMEIAQQFAAAHPGDESLSALGFAHRYMSRALQAFGDLEGALRHARESVAAREAVAAGKGGNTALLRELLNGYEETAYVAGLPDLPNLGDYHMATTYARKVIALAEQLAAADPHNARARSDLGIAYSNACALFAPLNLAAAREWCRKALEIYPPSRPGAYRYTLTLLYQARVWRKLGQPARVRDSLREAIAALANPARPDRMEAETRRVLLRAHNEMGAALVDLREPAAALEHHREALAIAEAIVAERPSDLVARRDLAECYEGLGRADRRPQACDWYRQSLDIWSRWATWGVSSVYDTERRKQAQQRLDRCLAWAHQ
jgi:tetratricopeptide (TPR) repeat protein